MAASERPRRVLLFGPPGSGKGTQAACLARHLGVPAISTGEMLREAVRDGTELGRRVADILDRGDLVDDDTMGAVVEERLARRDAAGGFLLDGYPRTIAQGDRLDEILARGDKKIDAVLLLEVGQDELVRRLIGRGRGDDEEDVIRERLRIYHEKTAPLEASYRERGLLRAVVGNRAVEEVAAAVIAALGTEEPWS